MVLKTRNGPGDKANDTTPFLIWPLINKFNFIVH